MPDDINGLNAPVILVMNVPSKGYKLFQPIAKQTHFLEESKIKLICTNEDNFLKRSSGNQLTLTCTDGEFLDASGAKREIRGISCEKLPTYVIKKTTERCAVNFFIYHVGYEIDSRFYGPIYKICYGDNNPAGFYTHHIINGQALKCKSCVSLFVPFNLEPIVDLLHIFR